MNFYKKISIFILLFLHQSIWCYVSVTTPTITGMDINQYTGDVYISTLNNFYKVSPVTGESAPTLTTLTADFINIPTYLLKVLYGEATPTCACVYSGSNNGNNDFLTVFKKNGETFNIASKNIGTEFQGETELNTANSNDVNIVAIANGTFADMPFVSVAACDGTADPVNTLCIECCKVDWAAGDNKLPIIGNTTKIEATSFYSGAGTPTVTFSKDLIMHYNSDLNKLYVATPTIQLTIGAESTYQLTPLVLFHVDNAGITKKDLLKTPEWKSSAPYNILGREVSGATNTFQLSVHDITTLKTNDDIYYLIFHGGIGAKSATYDQIYSIPLVSDLSTNDKGQLAKRPITPPYFTLADDRNDLYTTANAPRVGGNTVPWADTATVKLYAFKETVYALVNDDANIGARRISGLYYSTATVDDATQAITSWSNWARALPRSRGVDADDDGRIADVAIDFKNWKVWAIPYDDTPTTLTCSSWSKNIKLASVRKKHKKLTRTLADIVDHGKSLFDTSTTTPLTKFYVLDQAYQSVPFYMIGGTLLSGKQGVAIMRQTDADIAVNDNNFKLIELPDDAPKILSIGYSNYQDNDALGIIIIGTQDGLYALLVDNADTFIGGFPKSGANGTANMDDLDAGYWANAEIIKIFANQIKGNIVNIYSQGNGIYFLSRELDPSAIHDKIYRITAADLNAGLTEDLQATLIIESGKDKSVESIHIFDILKLNTKEQLILGTVEGAFLTHADGGIQIANPTDIALNVIPFSANQIINAFIRQNDGSIDIVTRKPFTSNTVLHNTNITFADAGGNGNPIITPGDTTVTSVTQVLEDTEIVELPSAYSEDNIPTRDPYYDTLAGGVLEEGGFTDGARLLSYTNYTADNAPDANTRSEVLGLPGGNELPNADNLPANQTVHISQNESVFDGLTIIEAPTLSTAGNLTFETVYHTLTLD